MWEAKADRMLLPGICHSLRGDFSWPKMGILKWPLTTCQGVYFFDLCEKALLVTTRPAPPDGIVCFAPFGLIQKIQQERIDY